MLATIFCCLLTSCGPSNAEKASIRTKLTGTWYQESSSSTYYFHVFTPDNKYLKVEIYVNYKGDESIKKATRGTYDISAKYIKCKLEDGDNVEIIYDYNKNTSQLVSIGSGFEKTSSDYSWYSDYKTFKSMVN